MTDCLERTWHWKISCLANGLCFGSFLEPMCSRAWRRQWDSFIAMMAIAFVDPVHCQAVHLRWLELNRSS